MSADLRTPRLFRTWTARDLDRHRRFPATCLLSDDWQSFDDLDEDCRPHPFSFSRPQAIRSNPAGESFYALPDPRPVPVFPPLPVRSAERGPLSERTAGDDRSSLSLMGRRGGVV